MTHRLPLRQPLQAKHRRLLRHDQRAEAEEHVDAEEAGGAALALEALVGDDGADVDLAFAEAQRLQQEAAAFFFGADEPDGGAGEAEVGADAVLDGDRRRIGAA